VSKFIQSLTDYELRGIKVNFKRHLALLYVVSRCLTPLFSAALSGLTISVAPLSHVRILPVHPSVSLSICLSVCMSHTILKAKSIENQNWCETKSGLTNVTVFSSTRQRLKVRDMARRTAAYYVGTVFIFIFNCFLSL